METILFSQGFRATDAIRQHVERRVAVALGAAAREILQVVVRVRDLNARRGGVDKACQISVPLPGACVSVRAVHPDLYAAIDAAAAKLRRAVLHRLRRRRTLRWQFEQRRLARRGAQRQPIFIPF